MVPADAPLRLLKNATLYDPTPRGVTDLLVGGGRILAVGAALDVGASGGLIAVDDLAGATVIPGLVDAHVHVTGGGGEAGFSSRVPPRMVSELARAGVTSVVGVLGTDGRTRTMRELVARTYGLREEGISAWCWTGCYEVPVRTLTGSVRDDVVFIEPVLGVGELAISDHRSSQPTLDELLRVASDVHVAGLMTHKAGVLHLHLGDGARGLDLVQEACTTTELPPRVFHPTHLNRRRELLEAAIGMMGAPEHYAGMQMDLTAFPAEDLGDGLSAADALATIHAARGSCEGVTVSSDGGGCMPKFDGEGRITAYGVGQCSTLIETLRDAQRTHDMPLEEVLPCMTRSVASLLRLPRKGTLAPGDDADLVVLTAGCAVHHVMARGRWMVRDGMCVAPGPFES
ncbi:MAG: beta-aspartyl-peptidase [Nannocystaceae bacterium]